MIEVGKYYETVGGHKAYVNDFVDNEFFGRIMDNNDNLWFPAKWDMVGGNFVEAFDIKLTRKVWVNMYFSDEKGISISIPFDDKERAIKSATGCCNYLKTVELEIPV